MSELISGKEALIALANGEEVETKRKDEITWSAIGFFAVNVFKDENWEFRIKPRTISLNGIEVPAPFEPEEGEEYWYITDCEHGYGEAKNRVGYRVGIAAWRTEDEIKQVVAALRSIFNPSK